MRALIQRVKESSVTVDDEVIADIDEGLLVFLGVGEGDKKEDADYLVEKIINLRIFEDDKNKMNLSALDLDRELLIVSQFTLYGDCSQGRRPSFFDAAAPNRAEELYEYFVEELKKSELNIETGEFKAMMEVDLINDGPVTFFLDSND